jgi:hypothetical protein
MDKPLIGSRIISFKYLNKTTPQQKIKFKRALRVNHVYLSHPNFVTVDCAALRLPARNFI